MPKRCLFAPFITLDFIQLFWFSIFILSTYYLFSKLLLYLNNKTTPFLDICRTHVLSLSPFFLLYFALSVFSSVVGVGNGVDNVNLWQVSVRASLLQSFQDFFFYFFMAFFSLVLCWICAFSIQNLFFFLGISFNFVYQISLIIDFISNTSLQWMLLKSVEF